MALSKRARLHLTWTILILIGLGAAVLVVFADGGLLSYYDKRSQLQSLREENQQLHKQRQEYLDRIERLKNDPQEKERIIRGKEYAKPNEIIIEIPEEKSPPPPQR